MSDWSHNALDGNIAIIIIVIVVIIIIVEHVRINVPPQCIVQHACSKSTRWGTGCICFVTHAYTHADWMIHAGSSKLAFRVTELCFFFYSTYSDVQSM